MRRRAFFIPDCAKKDAHLRRDFVAAHRFVVRAPAYNRGSSYRRKMDSMGRYSRDEGKAKDLIERMMQDTDDPNVKEALRQAMHVVENG